MAGVLSIWKSAKPWKAAIVLRVKQSNYIAWLHCPLTHLSFNLTELILQMKARQNLPLWDYGGSLPNWAVLAGTTGNASASQKCPTCHVLWHVVKAILVWEAKKLWDTQWNCPQCILKMPALRWRPSSWEPLMKSSSNLQTTEPGSTSTNAEVWGMGVERQKRFFHSTIPQQFRKQINHFQCPNYFVEANQCLLKFF